MDGTLASSNIVQVYLAFRLSGLGKLRRWVFLLGFLPWAIFYILLDLHSRSTFNRVFYRRYRGVLESEFRAWGRAAVAEFWQARLAPAALRRIEEHLAQGHRVVVVSGGLAPVVEPLARHLGASACVAAQPSVRAGRLTGQLKGGVLAGAAKARETRRVAAELGVDLAGSYAYADSTADLEILECVGNPYAVNPDRALRRVARERQWPVVFWRLGGD